jgi:lipid II:glycine glycyltransferase (peptidoglycan interpeptide bridge formation enzyme)
VKTKRVGETERVSKDKKKQTKKTERGNNEKWKRKEKQKLGKRKGREPRTRRFESKNHGKQRKREEVNLASSFLLYYRQELQNVTGEVFVVKQSFWLVKDVYDVREGLSN